MKGQTKEELLEQSYPTTVTEILVMLNVINILTVSPPKIKDFLNIDESP
ncbi:hypothetical protein MiSe_94770 [Microseira wollei NIES-4236]|uniref:Uncharacterized protein n=2 Tax=Microseira wollei TaxID=467598 RepID=A0AAV3XRX5_9CYAN|nr:hypothetical protein MiSe_94770 [Microseira wollei NIES-4236]